MKKEIIYILVALLFGLAGCCEEKETIDVKGRTVLVYMVASNLGGQLNANIEDMILAATAKNLNYGKLVVFYSENQHTAELFEIKEGAGGVVTRHHIRDYENMSAVSPATMREVIDEVIRLYPNESYGMVLSSHGTAWLPAGSYGLRSFGEENGRKMEIYELAEGLPDHVFDFLLFDVCSMASVECVYELRNKAAYIVASPSEIISYGIPFRSVLPHLFTKQANLEKAAEEFYLFYKTYMYPYGMISVTRTDKLEELAGITKEILAGATTTIFAPPLPDWQLLANWYGSPTKLYDIADVIGTMATEEQQARFRACLNETVSGLYTTEYIYCTNGNRSERVLRYSGLSIYPFQEQLPELNEWYRRLEWYKAVY